VRPPRFAHACVIALLSGCAASERLCNGSAAACDLRVDQVLFPRTHNSHASEQIGYARGASNQLSPIPTQLNDGIRSFNVDTYLVDDTLIACHGLCALGQQDAAEIFQQLASFLEAHPTEVIELDFQAYGHDPQLADALTTSGLAAYAATRRRRDPWPTLGALIDAGTPLLIFTAQGGEPAWLHAKDQHISYSAYEYNTPEDFDCELLNQVDGGLFEVEHHLYRPFSFPELAEEANTREVLLDRIDACEAEHGVKVNSVGVDFYEIGAYLETIAERQP
jgi:hypothetical protein